MKLKILSLCDGIAVGLLSFIELDPLLDIEYHAVEIDSYARKVADDNFPEIIRWENDVEWVTKGDIEKNGPFDWVIFGSPCQSFSVAGNGKGLDGKSGLLINCLEILKWCQEFNPKLKFLIENVKMKKEFLDQFNALVGRKGFLINSALVSAQKRERYYWTPFELSLPEDRGIFLESVIEKDINSNLFFEPKNLDRITESKIITDPKTSPQFVDRQKDFCLDANYWKGTTLRQYLEKSRRQVVFAYSSSQRETCIEHRSNLGGKSNTLTTGSGCSGGLKSSTLVGDIVKDKLLFRKLTVRECARLQTIPDWFSFKSVSNSQAYKAIGNGWNTETIKHILKIGLSNAL